MENQVIWGGWGMHENLVIEHEIQGKINITHGNLGGNAKSRENLG